MPRRESCSPVPRRSPRAAVKASASPSPIIRASRSRSTASKETTTPKTRVASPSPKRRAPAKSAKAEKDETPKQSSRTSVSKKAADEKKAKSPATPKTAVSSKSRSRSRQKNIEEEEKQEPKQSERRSRSRTQVTKAAAKTPEVKKEIVASSRRSRAQPKEESEEEEEEEEPKIKSDKKKPPPKQQESEQIDDGSASRTASRSRRAASRQSEESKVEKEKEVVKESITSRPMRSRSRVQAKKAEEESSVEVPEEGRATRGRRSEPSETKDTKSRKITPPKKSRVQSKAAAEAKDTEPSEIEEDEATKTRKRRNAEVEKSPEIALSSRKRRRKLDDVAANEVAISETVSRSKKRASVPLVESKAKDSTSETGSDDKITKVHNVEIVKFDKLRTETDMDIEEISTKSSPEKVTRGRTVSSSPTKQERLQSKTKHKNAMSMKVSTVDEPKIQTELVDTSESPTKFLDNKDLSKDTIKKDSKDMQLSQNSDNSPSCADLSKNRSSCTNTQKISTKSRELELEKTTIKIQIPVEVSKSPAKSHSAEEVTKSTAKPAPAVEVTKSPAKPAPAVEVTKSPAKPAPAVEVTKSSAKPAPAVEASRSPAMPTPAVEASKSPAKPAPAVEALKSPAKPAPAVEVTKSPTKPAPAVETSKSSTQSSVEIKLSKSPSKVPSASDMPKNIIKSPVTINVSMSPATPTAMDVSMSPATPTAMDVSMSPAKPPVDMDVTESPAKPPASVDVAKSPAKPPASVDVAKSPAKPPAAMDVAKSPAKPPATMDVAKSLAKPPTAPDVAKSLTKSPTAMDVAKSPTALDVTKSSLTSPGALHVAKSSVTSPTAMDVAKSLVTSSAALTMAKSPEKSAAAMVSSSGTLITVPQKEEQDKYVTGSQSSNINVISSVSSMSAQSTVSHNQTATGVSKVLHGSGTKPTIMQPVSSLKSPLAQPSSLVISDKGVLPSKPPCQPCESVSPSKSLDKKELLQSTSQIEVKCTTSGKSQMSQVSSMLSSKPISASETGISSGKQSFQIPSQSPQPLVQNPARLLDSTISSSAQSPGQSQTRQPLTQSAKPSFSEKPSVESTNVLTQQSVKSVASSTAVPTNANLLPAVEQGTNSSSVKSSLVPNPHQLPAASLTEKPVSSLSPGALQKNPDLSGSGNLGPSSQSDKPMLVPTEQTAQTISSINITSGSLQAKTSEFHSSSISSSKSTGVSEKINPGSSVSPKPPTSVSCTSNKPNVTSESENSTKPPIVSESPKHLVSPPIVSVGQSGGLPSLSSKTQSSAISNLKPHVTHVTGGASSKPLVTHMTGVVPQKPSTIHSAAVMPTKTSSLSPNKSQVFSGFNTSPPKPPSSVVSKPSIIQQSESSGTSVKPQQMVGTLTSPAKPQITHMAGIAVHSRPQVTHMSGIAPKSGTTSDISSHPKPPVVHVTGSAVPKTHGTISPSVATSSPPKTSNSSASLHSSTSVSSTADGSSSSSQLPLKCPLVPVTSAGTEKPIVSPSLCSSTKSGQHQTQPDSSLGQSSSIITQGSSSASVNMSSSSQTQSSTKSVESKPVSMPDTSTKFMQPSLAAGQQLIDTKAQSSLTKAPESSFTSSAKSLSTTVSNSVLENQSKVPTPNLQASIPGISSTATAVTNKPASSSTSSSSITHGQTPSTVTPLQSQSQQSAVSVTVGNVQGPGAIPTASTSLQLAASKTSSSAEGVINGSSSKTSAGVQLQSSEMNKKRKLDSEESGENPESKKARVSAEDSKSLIANGQKDTNQSLNKPEVMDVDPSPSMKQDSNGNEVSLKDYVVVNKNELPHKDSPEVKQSLPKASLSNPTPTPLSSGVSSSPSITCSSSSSNQSGTVGSSVQTIDHKDILLNRAFKLNPALFSSTITEKSKQFSVVTYNILADCHFRRNDKMDRYPADEKPFIELPARHRRLMAELRYIDADIVCLQEVEPEYYSKTLSPDMQKLGYEGFYKKRVHENFDEGETTFYKTSRFSDPENTAYSLKQLIDKDIQELSLTEDVKESVRKFMCRPDVVLVTRLRCKNTGKFITVGNVHVNWGQFKLPNLQCVQIARAIREVVNRAGNDSSPHVICGDFNSFPTAPGYQLASEGYLSHSMIQFLQSSKTMEMPDGTKSALIDHLWEGFQHTSSSLKSAYAVVQGREPDLTTRTTNTQECLDYVFYSSSSLEAVGVLQVPHKQTVLNCKFIPNRIFPSDHLSLKAVLAFK